jgi:hypothetical protein
MPFDPRGPKIPPPKTNVYASMAKARSAAFRPTFMPAPAKKPAPPALRISSSGLNSMLGANGMAYRTMMEHGIRNGYLPGQLSPQELGYLGSQGISDAQGNISSGSNMYRTIQNAGYVTAPGDDLATMGYFLPGTAIGRKMGAVPYYDPNGGYDPGGDGGGGGGGGEDAVQRAKFNESYSVEGAPSWWRGLTPDVWNPESEYMALVNSVLPFLSPEDQRASAQSLARMYPEFAGYGADANPGYAPPPTEMDSGAVSQYLSASRSKQIMSALERMVAASGRKKEDFGPGYSYFKQLASTLGSFGGAGESGTTRTQYQQLLGQLDPMLAESGGGQLGAYGAIAKMLTNPFFTAGQLGNVIFGTKANAQWF